LNLEVVITLKCYTVIIIELRSCYNIKMLHSYYHWIEKLLQHYNVTQLLTTSKFNDNNCVTF
jgi:uncharacterized protein involved in tolerance to divalent cations